MSKASNIMALLSIIIVFCLLFYFEKAMHPIFNEILHNADSLYLPTLFRDIFSQNGHISNWYLTPAPYFFPDAVLFGVAYSSTDAIPAQILIFAMLQISVLWWMLYFLFLHFNSHHARNLSLFVTILLIYLGLQEIQPYALLFHSAFHFGCFLMEIWASALWINWFTKKQNKDLILLIIISLFTTFSDSLFLIQAALPLFFSYGLLQFKNKQRIALQDTLPLLSSLLGYALYPHLITHPTRYPMRPSIHQISTHLLELKKILLNTLTAAPLLTLLILMVYCSLTVLISRRSFTRALTFFSLFVLISAGTTLLPPLFMPHFETTIRYFIPQFIWPIIALVTALSLKIKKFNAITLPCTSLLIGILTYQCVTLYQQHPGPLAYYPKELACIDEALSRYPNLEHGVAEYWDAKLYQAYSQHPIRLAQYTHEGLKHRWITSEAYFRSSYDFAIRNASDHSPLTPYAPIDIVSCETHAIWVYGKDQLHLKQDFNLF